jgi:hypothetical protein
MQKAGKGKCEKHAGSKNHVPFSKPALNRVGGGKGTEKTEEFEVGGKLFGGMLTVT